MSCKICLEQMGEHDTHSNFDCNHTFHEECVNVWYNNVCNLCPLCKTPDPTVMIRKRVTPEYTVDVGYNFTQRKISKDLFNMYLRYQFDMVDDVTFIVNRYGKELITFSINDVNRKFEDLKTDDLAGELYTVCRQLRKA